MRQIIVIDEAEHNRFGLRTARCMNTRKQKNRCGGVLSALSAADRKQLGQYKLDASPVWNGMAAVEGLLLISCRDGSLVCFESKERSE